MATIDEIDTMLAGLSPERRAALLRIGRTIGTDRVIEQGNKVLNGLQRHGVILAGRGFGTTEAQELRDYVEFLVSASQARTDVGIDNTVGRSELADSMHTGKALRMDVRVIITSARTRIVKNGVKPSDQTVATIDAVLAKTSSSGADPLTLASQLESLVSAAGQDGVVELLNDESKKTIAESAEAAKTIRKLSAAVERPQGTPEETQRLDFIDGLAIELVRQARAAARAADRRLHDPGLANAFELDVLYGR